MCDCCVKYFDTHTLFIKCGSASMEQIYQILNDSLDTYRSTNDQKIKCDFYVNVIKNRENVSFGIAFIFISNPEVYHMLTCKNPDGTERIEYRDNPTWIAPSRNRSESNSSEQLIDVQINNQNLTNETDWYSFSKTEDEIEKKLLDKKNDIYALKLKMNFLR